MAFGVSAIIAVEFKFIIKPEQQGQRLDLYLSLLPELGRSRSQVKKLIESGNVLVNNDVSEPSCKLKADDRIKITVPAPEPTTLKPENLPLEIVYEDNDIVVVNKPKGMVTHPAPGNRSGTLVNALLHHCDHLAPTGAPVRPGIVHRLDKDTSGLLVVAKTDQAYHSLVRQLKERKVEKTYVALVHGVIKNNSGVIEARIGRHPVQRKKMAVIEAPNSKHRTPNSREAFTSYKVIQRFKYFTLVEVKIMTGRTHQIRVHLSFIGFPLVGDPTYGKKANELDVAGQLLHARKLGFFHPRTNEFMEFSAALPEEFQRVLQKIA